MLENRKDGLGMIIEGLHRNRASKVNESAVQEKFDYEAYFSLMEGEPGFDAMECTNMDWTVEGVGEPEIGPVDEATMVTPQGRMYPKENIAIVLSGGAGSGKGFTRKNYIAVDGKVLDVDRLKELYVAAVKKGSVSAVDGKTEYNFKNPEDVSQLHQAVKDKAYKEKTEDAFFGAHANGKRPNVIYDITGDSGDKLKNTGRMLKELGYHVVLCWVVVNREIAMIQNFCRDRVVSQEVFHSTHNGVLKNVLPFLKSSNASYYDEAWVIFGRDSLKKLTKEQQRILDQDRTVKLTKNGSKFDVPADLEERILAVLGPAETDPANTKVYKSYQDIQADPEFFAKAKKGDAGLLK